MFRRHGTPLRVATRSNPIPVRPHDINRDAHSYYKSSTASEKSSEKGGAVAVAVAIINRAVSPSPMGLRNSRDSGPGSGLIRGQSLGCIPRGMIGRDYSNTSDSVRRGSDFEIADSPHSNSHGHDNNNNDNKNNNNNSGNYNHYNNDVSSTNGGRMPARSQSMFLNSGPGSGPSSRGGTPVRPPSPGARKDLSSASTSIFSSSFSNLRNSIGRCSTPNRGTTWRW